METEHEMVTRISTEHDLHLHRLLRKVDRTGQIGRKACEVLLINDLISFGGPRERINPYNCYRLTERGRELIQASIRKHGGIAR